MMRLIGLMLGICVLVACSATDAEETEMTETTPPTASDTFADVATRFATLALDCVHREYPNKISHVMQADSDAQPPRQLTPIFYGCFDWHSSVHGHWLLTRMLHLGAAPQLEDEIRAKLAMSFQADAVTQEVAYYMAPGRAAFERPYGIAWYLQLVAELHESDDAQMQAWRDTLQPLEEAIVARILDWLPKLSYPVRLGTHNQTAFAFGLMLDYARTVGDSELETALVEKIRAFHIDDVNCPLAYEPSGEDFLSPCLMEADLMRRILTQAAFGDWLSAFLPQIPQDGSADWLAPGIVLDASDGKLVHLDGVNLSRAWALEGIAQALPDDDVRRGALQASADLHKQVGIAAVSDVHYAGSHWLASFATYLVTQRGFTTPTTATE